MSSNLSEKKIKEYIDDQVRQSTDSSIQSLTNNIADLKRVLREHAERETESRESLKEDVKRTIKETVNGKIDRMQQGLDKSMADLAPIIKEYQDNKTTKETLERKGMVFVKGAAALGTLAGGVYVIRELFQWITQ